MWDVYLQSGDTLDSFVEAFDTWYKEQGHPRFFQVSVYVDHVTLVNKTTIEGLQEWEIFRNALTIGRMCSRLA